MTFVITQSCCNDASCVPVCPVNCIHPTPDEPDYDTAEMLYIDPDGCIECGACLDACPVGAIEPDYDLPEESLPFIDLNRVYFEDEGRRDYSSQPYRVPAPTAWEGADALRVAVVGTGPSAMYAVQRLVQQRGLSLEINVFERLLTPGGLLRSGVAPDHQSTKAMGEVFSRLLRHPAVTLHLGVDVGGGVTIDDLMGTHHAVVAGIGAAGDRSLGIEGESLPGSMAATDLVGWYNGHPDVTTLDPDLATTDAIVVGNGNVAMDVARVLAIGASALNRTDIAEHALEALGASEVQHVRILARRGAAASAFTTPELLGLTEALGGRLYRSEHVGSLPPTASAVQRFKFDLVSSLPTAPFGDGVAVMLDYGAVPTEVVGADKVESLRVNRVDLGGAADPTRPLATEDLPCGLLVRAIGYRSRALRGLPFDDGLGIVPNADGRVLDSVGGLAIPGLYVTGWAKRGPSGVIGTNKRCSRETVDGLLADWSAGLLARDLGDLGEVDGAHGVEAWKAIDAHEVATGRAQGRPRRKVARTAEQLEILAAADA